MQIAIFGRTIEKRWEPKLCRIVAYLESRGVAVVWFEQLSCPMASSATFTLQSGLPDGCNLLLNVGGDGTFLESLILIKERAIPVAGINFGRLGFLAGLEGERCDASCGICEGDSESYDNSIGRLITGDYSVEKRTVIEVSSPFIPDSFFPYALNECALQRNSAGMISIDVHLRSGTLPAYWADGLIVATPTGSTAYSLSVGGPIVFPGSDVLTVAPIAPHNLNMRPIVIADSEELTVYAQGRAECVTLTLDNRSISIPCGSEVKVRKAPFALHYVSLQGQHFISALHEKLLWGFDKRNTPQLWHVN